MLKGLNGNSLTHSHSLNYVFPCVCPRGGENPARQTTPSADTPLGRHPLGRPTHPWADPHPPWAGTHSLGRHTPAGKHTPQADTPRQTPPRQTPPRQTPPRQTPPPRDDHCIGRDASYWNAFLFTKVKLLICSLSYWIQWTAVSFSWLWSKEFQLLKSFTC